MSDSSQPATSHPAPVISARPAWLDSLLRPILAFRLSYVPVVMVYFAYGALGLIDVTRDLWIKESADADARAARRPSRVWLSLPWTIKMVFGELVDSVPIFGSQRNAYVLIGATLHGERHGHARRRRRRLAHVPHAQQPLHRSAPC